MTCRSSGSGTWLYGWDYENRPLTSAADGMITVSYQYDALGRRIKRTRVRM
ncbi:MAG: hypothetical protein R2681_06690 [Pyrinomonadaceae bacterium]